MIEKVRKPAATDVTLPSSSNSELAGEGWRSGCVGESNPDSVTCEAVKPSHDGRLFVSVKVALPLSPEFTKEAAGVKTLL
ncbi:hypothetical protein BaRGS_00030976 [Batillaria attramentaria]|uniref:Uncharacterized protein n=1 Tax=Batillaria attramentaria TaxID=370345 RepID=A0ABD0JT91_9CAEN